LKINKFTTEITERTENRQEQGLFEATKDEADNKKIV